MLSPEERARLTSLQDQLIELLVYEDEAQRRCDDTQVAEIREEIDQLTRECEAIRGTG